MHTWYTQVTVHLRKMIWRSYVNRWLSADVPGILYSELNNSVWWFLLGYSHVFPKSSKCYWNLVSGFPIWKKSIIHDNRPYAARISFCSLCGCGRVSWCAHAGDIVPQSGSDSRGPTEEKTCSKIRVAAIISLTMWESNMKTEYLPFADKFASGNSDFWWPGFIGWPFSICLVGCWFMLVHWIFTHQFPVSQTRPMRSWSTEMSHLT
jgi:hypothetical protein